MSDETWMGSLAAQDDYQPASDNPWPPDPNIHTASPLVNITPEDINRASDVALSFSGGGLATRDPTMWHGLSVVKLPKPLAEITPDYKMATLAEQTIKPSDLQGGWLMPGLGDRSLAGGRLLGVGGEKFVAPVPLEGGHGFMPANVGTGAAWASEKGPITIMANKAKKLSEGGDPVYFPYTAMGERSVDFSHHVSDTLTEMLKGNPPSRAAADAFNSKMNVASADYPAIGHWPGVEHPDLGAYLRDQSGVVRNKFAKIMDTRQMQDAGFPSVAEARYAVTDPRLLDVPTGASGLSIARLDPMGSILTGADVPNPHSTYRAQLGGAYIGGLGRSIPKEVMFPDLIQAYSERGYAPVQHDYLMARGLKGAPVAQKATQKWVDRVSRFMEEGE
jgi:hypothetical protein